MVQGDAEESCVVDRHDEQQNEKTAPSIGLLAERLANANTSVIAAVPDQSKAEDARQPESQTSSPDLHPTTRAQRFYTSAQWTADGTSILAASSDQTVASFILPADLLQPAGEPRHLARQASIKLPEPTQTLAGAPYFSLANPASQTFLVGCRDHPLHLYHAFPQLDDADAPEDVASRPIYTYKLIRMESEQYISPRFPAVGVSRDALHLWLSEPHRSLRRIRPLRRRADLDHSDDSIPATHLQG
ncbi:uncharacterized protein TrAtP1_007320 [Trichoderma atroviride]|uniref:uncharacterized protein n=1 Tax=Hypocrea atroviridis TaxID=63577 RepID=UPI0033188988|nr:hypothetical protein TrAtP1_007320 [Trichoderma atroviride]